MITSDIVSYIKLERAKNTPDSVIKSNLIANGWTEKDISEAMAAIENPAASNMLTQASIAPTKAYRRKVLWTTFFVLLGIDILIIIWFKITYGTYGVFGLSPLAIVLRILFILLVSSLASHRSKLEDTQSKAVAKNIMNVLGTIVLVIVISAGILFVGCLFLFSGGKGL